MIRIIGSIFIIGASTMAGYLMSNTYKKRFQELSEILRCIHILQNEINYTYTPLPEAFINISIKCKQPYDKFFGCIGEYLYSHEVYSVYEAFSKSFEKNKSNLNVKIEDIDIILDLAKTLGQSDVEGQKKIFSLTVDSLKKQIAAADSLMIKNMKMYRYLGFSMGAAIVIMLI